MPAQAVDTMSDRHRPDQDELRRRLTPEQYHVTQERGTEPAFSGRYHDCKTPGLYHCIVCGAELFSSNDKYDSGTGWPSFRAPVSDAAVATHIDRSHGMVREEAVCGSCGAHLGHVFPDGPPPTGTRYCINSASLDLRPVDSD